MLNGTLFGQSSTGGAINYVVAKPTDSFEAGFDASCERFNRAGLSGKIAIITGAKPGIGDLMFWQR